MRDKGEKFEGGRYRESFREKKRGKKRGSYLTDVMVGFRLSTMAIGLSVLFLVLMANPASAVKCYEFTWPGDTNDTSCDEHYLDNEDKPIPCRYPMVYTVPSYYPPDLNDLEDHCSTYPCPVYKCERKHKLCIRWNWYDVNGNIYNYTAFCGTLADITKEDKVGAVPVNEGCWEQKVGTFTKEVCVCENYDYCNGAPGVVASLTLVSLFSLSVQLLINNYLIS